MISYSMSQVEILTGISAHTLRAWERRYTFLVPERSESNIRSYSDEQLKTLLNIGILVRNGYRISKLDKMKSSEIHHLVQEILTIHSEKNTDRINGLILSMLEMDEQAFDKIFNIAVIDLGFISTITEVIYPFLNLVGGLWTTNKIIPAQEHFISNLIRQKISVAIDALPSPEQNASRILLFLLESESHELGLLLSAFIAKKLGWKVYYLGQNVPLQNIKQVLPTIQPDLLMTMIITPRSQNVKKIIKSLIKDFEIPLLVSGNPSLFNFDMDMEKVHYLSSPLELENELNSLKKSKN